MSGRPRTLALPDRRPAAVLISALLLAPVAASCSTGQRVPRAAAPGATGSPTGRVAPADAGGPAAGACSPAAASPFVEFRLEADTAQPRCAAVGAAQHLRLHSDLAQATSVTIGFQTIRLSPGGTVDLPGPVGSYLAPGEHVLRVAAYGGSGADLVVQPS